MIYIKHNSYVLKPFEFIEIIEVKVSECVELVGIQVSNLEKFGKLTEVPCTSEGLAAQGRELLNSPE